MTIRSAEQPSAELLNNLTALWERSVRATHTFLTEEDIGRIAVCIPGALAEVPHLFVAWKGTTPTAFMGIEGEVLEMLFVEPAYRGEGIGTELVHYGIRHHGVRRLWVNEQNPAAQGFYLHLGFEVCGRKEQDEQGNPFPLLRMQLQTGK